MAGLRKGSRAHGRKLRWQLGFLHLIAYQLFQLIKTIGNLSDYTQISFDYDILPSQVEEEVHFWEKSPSCFHLNNICHGNDMWFYDNITHATSGLDANYEPKYQPTISYMKDKRYGARWPDYSVYFNVSSYNHSDLVEGCSYSPTPYHVVGQTSFNEMMGEFYRR